jgi:hypothetical protein
MAVALASGLKWKLHLGQQTSVAFAGAAVLAVADARAGAATASAADGRGASSIVVPHAWHGTKPPDAGRLLSSIR